LKKDTQVVVLVFELREALARAVGRTVVNQDYLFGNVDCLHATD
jgi:hypothetical protein